MQSALKQGFRTRQEHRKARRALAGNVLCASRGVPALLSVSCCSRSERASFRDSGRPGGGRNPM